MKTRPFIVSILLCAIAIVLAGCSASSTGDSHEHKMPAEKPVVSPAVDEKPAANEVRIEIEDFVFKPAEITISPGTKVTWINKDEAPHTATSTDTPQKFNSGGLDTDDKFSFVFNDKGEYPYFCALHPHMKASITVK